LMTIPSKVASCSGSSSLIPCGYTHFSHVRNWVV